MQRARVRVPQGEREHAHETLERGIDPPVLERREHHFGVGIATPAAHGFVALEGVAQLLEVVNLAIEYELIATACRLHRLVRLRCQVNYGQAPITDGDPRGWIGPHPPLARAPALSSFPPA